MRGVLFFRNIERLIPFTNQLIYQSTNQRATFGRLVPEFLQQSATCVCA